MTGGALRKRAVMAAVTLALSGCAASTARPVQLPVAAAAPAQPPKTMQWLYGSGEAAAVSIQAYHALRDHVLRAARQRPEASVILAEGSTLAAPRFAPCGAKPLAVVLDADETMILNLGYEYDEAVKGRDYDPAIWSRWEQIGAEQVAPVPGAVTALRAIRAAGVTVIGITNRRAEHAAQTERALAFAGLGAFRHRETLFLRGDYGTSSDKDPRRAQVASRYCVVAMGGDQLGDFSEAFNVAGLSVPDRRRAAAGSVFAQQWGAGWFMLPNPVYGPGVAGSYDDVFPADKRWSDPAGEK